MGPSVGRSREQRFLGRRPLRSCQNRVEEDNVVLIDEENDNCENVVVIDIPESTPSKVRGRSERLRRGKKAATSWTGVICLDDDDDDTDDHSDGDCVMNGENVKNGCSSSRKSNPPTSANFGSSSSANQENVSPLKLSKGKRTYSGKASSGTRFGIYDIDELSCDDLPDCELMEDSCGSVKEMWEKAYTKRKSDSRNEQTAQGDSNKDTYDAHENVKTSTDCGQCEEPPSVTKQAEHEGEASSIHKKKGNLEYTADDSLSDSTDNGVEDIFVDSVLNIHFSYGKNDTDYTQGSSFNFAECNSCHFSEPSSSGMPSMEEQKLKEPSSIPCQGKDTEQVKHANKHSHDNAEVPLRDSYISRSESCAKVNACVSEKNSSRCTSLRNQSVDSELGHGRFCSPDENGSSPEKTCSPFQKDPKCMKNSHEMKSSHQEASFSNTSSSHQHTANDFTQHGNKDKTVSEETLFDENSVCVDEMSIRKDSFQFDTEQLNERSTIFHSDRNEVHGPNNPDLHNDETNDPEHGEDGETVHNNECVMVGDREKLKETEEYKKAAEEEWASRQRALQIQAEEAQNLRRARKRMKAETMRILDMEKRQKQRLDEIRETEKKDQENSNLRDVIRAEVRRNLSILEFTCCDMATLLRALGIPVGGDLLPPLLSEVRVAYKKALLAFHPDRASRSDMRQQVEAEEKFKLISRMKEKFLPSL